MKVKAIMIAAVALICSAAAFAQNGNISGQEAIEGVLGQGEVENGVLMYEFPRNDLSVSVQGNALDPGIGLESVISFQNVGGQAAVAADNTGPMVVTGELCVNETELPGVIDSLGDGGLSVSAIHDHFVGETPDVRFVHFEGRGEAAALAQEMRDALQATASTLIMPASTPASGAAFSALSSATGSGGREVDGVTKFSFPLISSFNLGSVRLRPEMGAESKINIQDSAAGGSIMNAEIVVDAKGANPVITSLRDDGFSAAALHNHFLDENPRLFYVHALGTGDQTTLVTAALNAITAARDNRGEVLSNFSGVTTTGRRRRNRNGSGNGGGGGGGFTTTGRTFTNTTGTVGTVGGTTF